MCGIIAIVRKPESRVAPNPVDLLDLIEKAVGLLAGEKIAAVSEAKNYLEQVNQLLQGTSGLYALIDNANLSRDLKEKLETLYTKVVPSIEQTLHEVDIDPEEANELIVGLRDSIWAILHDRIETFKGVMNLASKSHTPSRAGYAVLLSIQQALNAIDRMEVRGRDSAGIQITLWGYAPDKEKNIGHIKECFSLFGAKKNFFIF